MYLRLKGLKGKYIKHPRMMDVCFKILSIYEGSTKYKLKGFWYNLGYVESFQIFPTTSNITVDKSSLLEWEWMTDKNDFTTCLRNAKWRQI